MWLIKRSLNTIFFKQTLYELKYSFKNLYSEKLNFNSSQKLTVYRSNSLEEPVFTRVIQVKISSNTTFFWSCCRNRSIQYYLADMRKKCVYVDYEVYGLSLLMLVGLESSLVSPPAKFYLPQTPSQKFLSFKVDSIGTFCFQLSSRCPSFSSDGSLGNPFVKTNLN